MDLNITNCYYSGLESGDIVVENSKPVEQVDSNSGSISITDLTSVIASKSKNDYEEMKKEYQVMFFFKTKIRFSQEFPCFNKLFSPCYVAQIFHLSNCSR